MIAYESIGYAVSLVGQGGRQTGLPALISRLLGLALVLLVCSSELTAANIGTGDPVIDSAQQRLSSIAAGKESDSKLIEALSTLFARPAFEGVRDENWRYMLYTVSKTRLMLEQTLPAFKSPKLRNDLTRLSQTMLGLQGDLASIYGPQFVLDEHIRRYIHSRDAFTQGLPTAVTAPTTKFFEARDVTIRDIRSQLKALGLVDF